MHTMKHQKDAHTPKIDSPIAQITFLTVKIMESVS
jgi:hypothetical protein